MHGCGSLAEVGGRHRRVGRIHGCGGLARHLTRVRKGFRSRSRLIGDLPLRDLAPPSHADEHNRENDGRDGNGTNDATRNGSRVGFAGRWEKRRCRG